MRKKSLADGSETLLVAADGMFRQGLRWTSDGSRLAYMLRPLHESRAHGGNAPSSGCSAGGGDEQILAGMASLTIGQPTENGFSMAGMIALQSELPSASPPSAAPRAETQWRLLASDPDHNLFQAHFSPDNRWIVFVVVKATDAKASTLYVIPRRAPGRR